NANELLAALLAEGVGVKQGASIAARMLGGRKQEWYARLQAMKGQH
ncbi:MAG TPA: rRNA (cytidine-2'-O-)-methyltransferase, partial [Halomonas sp.]|nr:rRNA (cytidine-2'-O-)-methyltransferase [Halomonas sp.]